MSNKVVHFGFAFRKEESLDPLAEEIAQDRSGITDTLPLLVTPNVDQLVKLDREENLGIRERLTQARVIIPDGQPIIWFSKIKLGDQGLQHRLTGSDLFPKLWKALRDNKKKVLFILPDDSLGESFKTEYDMVDHFAPPYFQLEDKQAYSAILEECSARIRLFQPDHVSIGLGFPKQETLALDLIDRFRDNSPFFSLLGASFEFYHGTKGRAPKWMQRIGLEFVHRMFSEPGRMLKRYLVDDIAIIPIMWREFRKGNP